MGVPAFYRWLVNKYPKIVVNAIEEQGDYVDITTPNPNHLEFDNLYLDMNGIIHPCFQPDHTMFPPTTFNEVFENIFKYIDRVVGIVRPRKILYLAIDGVAPRAKMNQQRARRFRTAKDSETAAEEENRLRVEFERKGKRVLRRLESEVSDSNVITPGTEFMYELSNALRSYICEKLNNHPGWHQIKVILSDAGVPGEGEHKIMSFIRSQRCLPGYDPNTRHCLYGLDADLIMLALATHELHFSILREDVLTVQEEPSVSESVLTTSILKATELYSPYSSGDNKKPFFDIRDINRSLHKKYQFVHIWILREYLEVDMLIIDPPDKFVFDVERMVDDFIFLCFFMGNDFLPHMPTLEIHENGIDLLLHVYKKEFKNLGGYLVDMQRVNDNHAPYVKLKRVEKFILSIGSYEEKIFKKRTETRDRKLRRILSELSKSQEDELDGEDFEVTLNNHCESVQGPSSELEQILVNTKELKEMLKNRIRKKSDIFRDGYLGSDKVKLGSVGWKQRYYKEKFMVDKEVETFRKEIVQKYIEGLCWVLLYYFSDVPSWNWYYPYYYGPFASDLKGLAQSKVRFQKGSPFKPFDQLMAVLPPRSAHALPRAYRELMTNSNSSIIDLYPTDFEVDLDGKRFIWQGICKLPFIDQERVLKETRQLDDKLEVSEAKRNVVTTSLLFTRVSNSSEGEFRGYLQRKMENADEFHPSEAEDTILCFNIELPIPCLHIPRLLEGVQPPQKIVFENDVNETVLWHEYGGNQPNPRYDNTRYRAAPEVNMVKQKMYNEASNDKFGGNGWGSCGRGKSISPETSFASSCALNLDASMENTRISSIDANRSSWRPSRHTQDNFWPSTSRAVSQRNYSSWRPVCSGEGSDAQVTGRGRGRPPTSGAVSQRTYSSWRPVLSGEGSDAQDTGRGRGRPSTSGAVSQRNYSSWRPVFSDEGSDAQDTGRGRVWGRGGKG